MPTTLTKVLLSGSTQGLGIKVFAIASPGTGIHSTGGSTSVIDEVTLWAVNSDTVDRKLTLEWGGTTNPDCLIEQTIPAESGLVLIVAGAPLTGSGSPRTISAFAETTNVIMVYGYVNRVTP